MKITLPLLGSKVWENYDCGVTLGEGGKYQLPRRSGYTALQRVVSGGNQAIIRLLVEKGAGVRVRDSYGNTPPHLAIYLESDVAIRLLLDSGADILARGPRFTTL